MCLSTVPPQATPHLLPNQRDWQEATLTPSGNFGQYFHLIPWAWIRQADIIEAGCLVFTKPEFLVLMSLEIFDIFPRGGVYRTNSVYIAGKYCQAKPSQAPAPAQLAGFS